MQINFRGSLKINEKQGPEGGQYWQGSAILAFAGFSLYPARQLKIALNIRTKRKTNK